MYEHEDELTQDVVFDLLSNRRRRYILSRQYERAEPTSLMTFAAEIAAQENNIPVDDVSDEQQKRVYVSIYQTHVPKLADAGAISYDPDSKLIELAENAPELLEYLHPPEDDEPPWQLIYVGVALVGLAVHLLGVVGAVSTVLSGFLATIGILVVAGGQYLYTQLQTERPPPTLLETRDDAT